jgi:serine/threonine protein kinase
MKAEDDNSDALESAKTLLSEGASKVASSDPPAAQPAAAKIPATGDAPTSILSPGTLLQGRYEIEKELGRGGIGAVFLARDTKLHSRPVVIKVLLEGVGQDDWVYKKFRQEVEALTRIEHPNIVGVLDSGEVQAGKPFIVMQYVDGATLRSQIKPEGMSLERVAALVRQVGRALGIAHSKGILHRDLKPENIMLHLPGDGEEQVKIIDFGIARVHDSQIGPTTATTAMVGTIAYMSPEQLTAKPLGVTSDIYALGIIAYEMVTGRRPFNPDSIFQLYEMQREGVRVNPKDLRPVLPEAAQAVLLKALAFAPEDRYQSAREFCDELADALESSFNIAPPSPARMRATREQSAATPTLPPPRQSAVPETDAPAVGERGKGRSWASPSVYISAAMLVALLAVTGVLLYKRLTSDSAARTVPPPPKLTPIEFNDEFLNLARWTVPPSGWNVNTREGRLEIENQPQVGFPTGINYDNFEMTFHLKLLNDAGAAWALRINDSNNYYAFYLSGPGGNYPNRFISYVVRDGKFNVTNFQQSTGLAVELNSGGQYQIDIKAQGNEITHRITPAETGDEVNLGLFGDPDNTFTLGGIGFRTIGVEKFSIDDLYVRPLGTKLPQ